MSDSQFDIPGSPSGKPGNAQDRMAESLQQAIRKLGGTPGAMLANGSLSPDALAELAQRAGLTAPGQIADLARLLGNATGKQESNAADATPQHIIFAIDTQECAFPAGTVQGVERIADVTPVPNTAYWVMGVIHLRGSIMSVVDLKAFLGLSPTVVTARSRMLIMTRRDVTIGLVVESITEMRQIEEQQQIPAAGQIPRWGTDFVIGSFRIEGRSVLVLDPDRLLFSEKMGQYHS